MRLVVDSTVLLARVVFDVTFTYARSCVPVGMGPAGHHAVSR